MAKRNDDNKTTWWSEDGQKWTAFKPDKPTYKLITEKIYSFSEYNKVKAFKYAPEDNMVPWHPASDSEPQAKIVRMYSLGYRIKEKTIANFDKSPEHVEDHHVEWVLPYRLVNRALADLLEGIPVAGFKGYSLGLLASDTWFECKPEHAEEVKGRLENSGWTVIDMTVKLADMEAILNTIQALTDRIITLAENAGKIVPDETGLQMLEKIEIEATKLVVKIKNNVSDLRVLHTRLNNEPQRVVDKAKAEVLYTNATRAGEEAEDALNMVKVAIKIAQQQFVHQATSQAPDWKPHEIAGILFAQNGLNVILLADTPNLPTNNDVTRNILMQQARMFKSLARRYQELAGQETTTKEI